MGKYTKGENTLNSLNNNQMQSLNVQNLKVKTHKHWMRQSETMALSCKSPHGLRTLQEMILKLDRLKLYSSIIQKRCHLLWTLLINVHLEDELACVELAACTSGKAALMLKGIYSFRATCAPIHTMQSFSR